ncbi:hypothetical protein PMG71_22195 [Roseofilum sp. BLCC_M154]|uniref:Uncharacterized protein n=1 Tax=Roseofilum acuticapitatum BLCC-M154 TaxID=3022444 RepID=A0ABT7B0F4_9CYAN|nr:hypothetical protein [Roseofilum acuticapitatum]MDJ1172144.1 hypothetical protein [Roseofilum acuticapitatum BLCC-M154]
MNTEINSICALNIRLFSYHLKPLHFTNFTEQNIHIASVTSYYQGLLNSYHILTPNSQPVILNFRGDFQDLIDSKLANFDLIPDSEGRGIVWISLPPKYQGFLYPQFLNDTYGFALTLFCPQESDDNEISFSDLSQVKPPKEFFSGTYSGEPNKTGEILSQAFWGTTLFLSGFIAQDRPEKAESLKSVANEVLKQFLQLDSLEQAPPFYHCGEFLGGYIYEYKTIFRLHPYGKILILLIFEEDTTKKLKQIQWDLPELFLYDHKNQQNFLDSRKEYKKAQKDIKKIEKAIKKFPKNIPTSIPPDLSDEDLKKLKQQIKNLLDLSLRYSQRIRSLETFQNTIAINQENYLDTLSRMETNCDSNLSVWRDKTDRTFQRFQRQIAADLVYLQQGERLLDTAINTIRGLVEIDQAESDRNLEHQIQTFGSAIAVGAIVASTSALIFDYPWTSPLQQNHGDRIHPFIIAVLVSFAFAAVAWGGVKLLIWCSARGRSGRKNR